MKKIQWDETADTWKQIQQLKLRMHPGTGGSFFVELPNEERTEVFPGDYLIQDDTGVYIMQKAFTYS